MSFDQESAIERMKVRQWRESVKIQIFYWECSQYPAYSPSEYFASVEEAKLNPPSYSADTHRIKRVKVRANSTTIDEMVSSGKINILELYRNEK